MRYRHLRRTAIAGLAAMAFVLLIALSLGRVLSSSRVRASVASWLEGVAHDRGLSLEVGSLSWGVLPPRVILRDVELTGSQFGVLVDQLEVELTRIRAARRIIELRTVAADGIRVRLEGIPRTAPRRNSSLVRIVVRHLDLRDISFQGNDLPGHVDLAVDGANLVWTTEQATPAGFLAAHRVRLSAPGLEPLDLSLQSRVVVDDDGVRFPGWRLAGEGLSLSGTGTIAGGAVRLDATGTAELGRAATAIRNPGLLTGRVRLAASLDTGADDLVKLEVSSPELTAAGFTFDEVAARLTVQRDQVTGVLDGATFHGGRLTGTYRLEHLSGPTRPHHAQVSLDDVSLTSFLRHLGVPLGGLAARSTVTGELAWDGRAINRGHGRFVARLRPEASGLPTRGTVALELTPDGLLRFASDDLQIGGSTVEWQGPLTVGSWQPDWSLRVSPADLGEVASVVNSLVGSEVLPPWIAGQGDLLVTLSGPWQSLVVGARVDARPLLLPPIELDQLLAEATISGSRLTLGPTRFRIGEGTGEVDGGMAWGDGSPADQLDLSIRGHQIPLATIADWVGAAGQAAGTLSFTGGLRGSIAEPRGSWAVGFDGAQLLGQPLGGGTGAVDLAGARFDARGLSFAGGLHGSAWWDSETGDIGGHLLWPAMSLAILGDELANLAGGTADVDLQFELPHDGWATGRFHADCPDAVVDAIADSEAVTVDAALADAAVLSATLERLPDGTLEGGGELRLTDVPTLIDHLAPGSDVPLTGSARATFETRWPAGGLPTVTGTLQAADLELDGRPVRLLSPSPFRLSREGAQFDGLHLAIRSDELFARCSVDEDGNLAGNLAGTLDALLLRILIPEWEPAGRATGVVELLGTLREPRFEGIAEVRQASFRIPGSRTILSGIDGTLLLSSDEVALEGVDFRFMQGRGRCSGRIERRDGAVNIALDGTVAAIRYEVMPDLSAQLSGAWRLVGPAERLELAGDLTVDSASLRSKDDLAALVLRWFGTSSPPPATGGHYPWWRRNAG